MKNKEERNIQLLLDRFMQGVSTLEEESILADYFRQHQYVKPEWADYKLLFDYINQGMSVEMNVSKTATPSHRLLSGWLVGATAVAAAVVLVFFLLKPKISDENKFRKVVQTEQTKETTPKSHGTEEVIPQSAEPLKVTAEVELVRSRKNSTHSVSQTKRTPQNNEEIPMDSLNNERKLDEKTLQEMLLTYADAEADRKIDEAIQQFYRQQRAAIQAANEFNFEEDLVVKVIPL